MSRANGWTNEEIKALKKAVRKAGSISAGCRAFCETSESGRSVLAAGFKYSQLMKGKTSKKRKYTKKQKAESPAERLNIAKGLTFDIQNIKRATLSGNNTLTLFF